MPKCIKKTDQTICVRLPEADIAKLVHEWQTIQSNILTQVAAEYDWPLDWLEQQCSHLLPVFVWKEPFTTSQLETKTVRQLKRLLFQRQLKTKGSKAQLILRLQEFQNLI